MYSITITKKHFGQVAAAIRAEKSEWGNKHDDASAHVALEELAVRMAIIFAADNPRFNKPFSWRLAVLTTFKHLLY